MFEPSNDDQIRFPFPKIYSFAGVSFFVQKLSAGGRRQTEQPLPFTLQNCVYSFYILLLSFHILYIMIAETFFRLCIIEKT